MEVKCPLCGEFEGPAKSVQAHISRSTDEAHQGVTGGEVLNNPGSGEPDSRPGAETQGTALDVPKVACAECGRKVKYPEMMPYKMTCPECGREMRKREAAEELEKKADEKGKDETVDTQEA
jgi:predicted RNA-binding Zn-ribbon protein involved in translation (DUF1610 family)